MKLLIIGEHFSTNLGDVVISKCFTGIMDRNHIDYNLLYLSGEKPKETQCLDLSDENEDNMRRRLKDILLRNKCVLFANNIRMSYRMIQLYKDTLNEEYDAAIYDGGSIFMGYFSIRQWLINRRLASKKIPVYYYACGMGKFNNKEECNFVKRALSYSNIRKIYLRDSIKKFECDFGFQGYQTYDVALLSDIFLGDNISSQKSRIVGIGYISLEKDINEDIKSSMSEVIQELERRKLSWEFFCNGDVNDYKAMVELYNDLKRKGLTYYGTCCKKPVCSEDLIGDISRYSQIVTCRLHSAIIAYSLQIPAYCIGWSEKVYDFYRLINHEEMVVPPIFDGRKVVDCLVGMKYSKDDIDRKRYMQEAIISNINNILTDIQKN